ncbi:MAG: GntR family transcriptional regulator [Deltaproteobacteria bacterium]|nr:GntR family transcriptional regulator [Candidatus Anaeroferrophillacea bacterium]
METQHPIPLAAAFDPAVVEQRRPAPECDGKVSRRNPAPIRLETKMSFNHQTLREQVVELLRTAIIDQRLVPGERILELDLANSLNVSRTPVREALHQLEAEGFLCIIPRRGVMVTDIDERDISEFYEIRELLETHAARRAAAVITHAQVEELRGLNRSVCGHAGRRALTAMTRAHNDFHLRIVAIGDNRKMHEYLKNLNRQFLRLRFMISAAPDLDELLSCHDRIIDALKAGNGDRAAAAMRNNLRLGCRMLIAMRRENGSERPRRMMALS